MKVKKPAGKSKAALKARLKYYTVPGVGKRISGAKGVEWTSADISSEPGSPLAMIRYKIDGKPQRRGLRVDLGKRVFLDKPKDDRVAAAIKNHGMEVIEFIGGNKIRLVSRDRQKKKAMYNVEIAEKW